MPSIVDFTITNGHVVTHRGVFDGGIAIQDGKIYAIQKDHRLPQASETLNAQGNLILPGLIDVHTHLRDLELRKKEDFYSGTCAAIAGGFTSILDMPNTRPLTNSISRLRDKISIVNQKSVANVGFYASLPDNKQEVQNLQDAGIFGIKLFLHRPLTSINLDDNTVLLKIFMQARRYDLLLAIHAEDKTIIETLEKKYRSQINSPTIVHSRIHNYRAELKAVKRILSLARHNNPRIHFCHISTHQAARLIRNAQQSGLNVSSEVTPHHAILSNKLVHLMGSFAQVEPPLRNINTVKRLQHDLFTGVIDIVASDHAPHTIDEKIQTDPLNIPSGFPGLETTLPIMLTLMKKGHMSLHWIVNLLAYQPAQRFRLVRKGALSPGFDADITIIDPNEKHVIDPACFYSKARYSPFTNMKVTGKPTNVILGGNLVMRKGEILAQPGSGQILVASSSSLNGRKT